MTPTFKQMNFEQWSEQCTKVTGKPATPEEAFIGGMFTAGIALANVSKSSEPEPSLPQPTRPAPPMPAIKPMKLAEQPEDEENPLDCLHINRGSFDAACDLYEAEFLAREKPAHAKNLSEQVDKFMGLENYVPVKPIPEVVAMREAAVAICMEAWEKTKIEALLSAAIAIGALPLDCVVAAQKEAQ